jgi:hypothetical protein
MIGEVGKRQGRESLRRIDNFIKVSLGILIRDDMALNPQMRLP